LHAESTGALLTPRETPTGNPKGDRGQVPGRIRRTGSCSTTQTRRRGR
jgi:hypothetical protein